MLCKNHKILFGTSFLAFCLALLFSVFLFTDNTYAVEDYVYTQHYPLSSFYLCRNNNNDYPNCSDYNYLIIENIGDPFTQGCTGPTLTPSTYLSLGSSNPTILHIDSSTTDIRFNNFQCSNGLPADNLSVKYTLTESISSCPEPEEPEPCPECQVCPTIPENPYDNKFDEVIKAIYTVGAILLVIYFFYCMYRMIIRNSGVK